MSDNTKPIVFVIFNRPESAKRVFESIARYKPEKLLVVADGPRSGYYSDIEKVEAVRGILNDISWNCQIHRNFSPVNLGCRKRMITGLTWAFNIVEEAIILEDDCLPCDDFFKFCSWGLDEYRQDKRIGMISGSNLVDYSFNFQTRNLFSTLINIWGWATWKRTWEAYDPLMCIEDLEKLKTKFDSEGRPSWHKLYWVNILKNALVSNSIWDFQMQYVFFMNSFLSVVPTRNLIRNIGFDISATHTAGKTPEYVRKSSPTCSPGIMDLPMNENLMPKAEFDDFLARTIWSFRPSTAVRVALMNCIRFLRI
jgi:hypothetical protein